MKTEMRKLYSTNCELSTNYMGYLGYRKAKTMGYFQGTW